MKISGGASYIAYVSVFTNIKPASELGNGTNYWLFRQGVKPEWEDPANAKGGRWAYISPKNMDRAKFDEYWLNTVLPNDYLQQAIALIGEVFDKSELVTGFVVSIRKREDRFQIWTKNTDNATIESMGKEWKKAINMPDDSTVGFQKHQQDSKVFYIPDNTRMISLLLEYVLCDNTFLEQTLARMHLKVLLSHAFYILTVYASYTPTFQSCPSSVDLSRNATNGTLSKAESDYISKQKNFISPFLQNLTVGFPQLPNISTTSADLPTIGLAFSGGGYRYIHKLIIQGQC